MDLFQIKVFLIMFQVVFFVKRNIYVVEEVMYDYKFNCDEVGDKIFCFCGLFECRGILNQWYQLKLVKSLNCLY